MVVCFSHAENASMTSPFSDKLAVRLIGEGNHVSAKILVNGHRDFLHFRILLKYSSASGSVLAQSDGPSNYPRSNPRLNNQSVKSCSGMRHINKNPHWKCRELENSG